MDNSNNNLNNFRLVKKLRKRAVTNKELLEKKYSWLSKLRVVFDYGDLEFCELYRLNDEVVKSDLQYEQFEKNTQYTNTRIKLPTETIFEIDELPKEEATGVIATIIFELMNKDIHFALFYAEGQRSHHIRIYNLEDLREYEGYHHAEYQKAFWRSIHPRFWVYADRGVWEEKHTLPLEFSVHYKTHTFYDLVFEHIPKKKNKSFFQEVTLWDY